MAHRFYINQALEPGPVLLQGAEAHHLSAVARLRPGDGACLFNGDGHEYRAEVTSVARRSVELVITEVTQPARELPDRLVVACPLPKGDRAQFLIEKLTELGVTAYVPLRTERSVVHPGEGRAEKLQRYVQEASKQCGRNVLMRIEPLLDWTALLEREDLPTRKWLGHPGGASLSHLGGECGATVIAVGAEGGFTAAEFAAAVRAGWSPIDLGPRILRVETAALVLAACATHQ